MKFILTALITCHLLFASAQNLPSAATCATALNIGGCRNFLPETFVLAPGQVDSAFFQPGVNQGCIGQPSFKFAFFYFTAGADGKFAFVAKGVGGAHNFDFNVWGPLDHPADICTVVQNTQPVRSSQAVGSNFTGLADIQPLTGAAVTDDFDCDSPTTPGTDGDGFVRSLEVKKGKTYVILLDDPDGAITLGGVTMNFAGTTAGVLIPLEEVAQVTPDTSVCLDSSLQLSATGGVKYNWLPADGLSCTNCPNPILTVSGSKTYQVEIRGACTTTTKEVEITPIDLNLGIDVLICTGVSVTLNPNPLPGQYEWIGAAGLSCTDCPSPVLTNPGPGFYTFIAFLTTPGCVVSDTISVIVLSGLQTNYNIASDTTICLGQSVNIGGNPVAGTFYNWSSNPPEFNSSAANPLVSPLQTTTYILAAASGSCPVSAMDSLTVTVVLPPVLAVRTDTSVCRGQGVVLGTTIPQPGVTYAWTPDNGTISDPTAANPIAAPLQSTSYTLTASNGTCTVTRTVLVAVPQVNITLSVADTLKICKGSPKEVTVTVTPPGTPVGWSPIVGLQITPNGLMAVANPDESALYTATATAAGCKVSASFWAQVDSLPKDLAILPMDTSICEGNLVKLISKTYQPSEYPNILFEWTPMIGQLTPDSLYNMVVQPDTTTKYQRITIIGACMNTDTATVNVIPNAEMVIVPGDTSICPGATVQLTLTTTPGVTDIKWMPSDILSCDDCNNPLATPTGSVTFMVTGEFMGCKNNTSARITVLPLPPYQFPADRNLCIGQSVTLNTVFAPNATYTWTSTDPAFGTRIIPQPTYTPTQTATYFLSATNGCPVTDQVTITVESATLQATGDTTVCREFPALLTAAGSQPGTFTWSSGQIGQAVVVNPAQTTTYTVLYQYGTDCQLTDDVTVTVSGVGATVAFPLDKELCPGDSVLLNSAATPGATYSWTSVPAGFVSSQPNPVVAPSQSTNYVLTTTNNGQCTNTQTVSIIAYNATLKVSNDTTVCQGEPVLLIATGSVTGTYQWLPGGSTNSVLLLNPAVAGSYSVLYTYGDDCTLTDVVNVNVVPGISVNLVADPDTNQIGLGQSLELTAIVSPTQSLTNFQFKWFEGSTTLPGTTDVITVKPTTTDTAAVVYSVIVTSQNGCTAQDFLRIRVLQPKVAFPNAFTPNGDEINNTFKMIVLEGQALVESMEIYSRWGQKIFSSSDPLAAWDGTYDGKPAPSDVYAYVIRWRDGIGALGIKNGDVTLLR